MITGPASDKRVTIKLSRSRGFEESQKDRIIFSLGPLDEKKRRQVDVSESEAKNSAMAFLSDGRAMPMVAVEPSRKINRPECGESW
jgi:hypothetical protein